MSHDLVIANDKDADYVKFDVLIPDGYSKFKVNCMNGTLINQNYINTNDKLIFNFANNPIIYDDVKLKVRMMINNNIIRVDSRNYEYVKFDIFNYYKLVFIPIYGFYFDDVYYYVFNPCDSTQLLSEPVKYLPPIQVSNFSGAITSQIYASFTGLFVMGLTKTEHNNIDDLTLTIGESIGNSKTKPQDLSEYSIQAEAVNDVKTQSIQTTAYNYGSTWNYPINNLIMKHNESITFNYVNNDNINKRKLKLIFGLATTTTTTTTTNEPISGLSIIKGVSSSNEYVFKSVDTISPYIHDLTYNFNLPVDVELTGLKLNILVNNNLIQDSTPNTTHTFTGSELLANNTINYVDSTDLTIHQFIDIRPRYINSSWTYSTNSISVIVGVREHGTEDDYEWSGYIDGEHITLDYEQGTEAPTLIKFDETVYVFKDVETPTYKLDVKFKIYDENTNDYITTTDSTNNFYLYGVLDAEHSDETNKHIFHLTTTLNTGFIDERTYNIINENNYKIPYQFISNTTPFNNEDLLINAEYDDSTHRYGLRFSMNNFNNVIHQLNYDEQGNYTHTTNYNFKWFFSEIGTEHINNVELLAFIPLKTHKPLIPFKGKLTQNWKPGFFTIHNLSGNLPDNLTNSNAEVFLADGWDSLTVQAVSEDDGKYKTFNGSLSFDRSNSRITRIFSNDATGSCLGYLNDILSAKLAKYYFVANVNIFNCFFPTDNTISINTSSKAINALYERFINEGVYSGNHSTVYCSCYDIIKLIGSENIINNCMPSLQVEQQGINTNVWKFNQLVNVDNKEKLLLPVNNEQKPYFSYKLFHYYNSGLNEEPYNGVGNNDDFGIVGTCGGLNLLRLNVSETLTTPNNNSYVFKQSLTDKPFYMLNGNLAYDNYETLNDSLFQYNNSMLNINKHVNDTGYIETLPTYRLYKNNNFEQTDLTISTGGIKTLHPIYLQSTPRIIINNILYMVDYVINYMFKSVGGFNYDADKFGFVQLMIHNNRSIDNLPLDANDKFALFRFGKVNRTIKNNRKANVALSFDSLFMLNYLNGTDLNLYNEGISDVLSSIPGGINNEEVINNLITESGNNNFGDSSVNVQLFSSKYFNFLDNVNYLSMVILKSQYIEQMIFNDSVMYKCYYGLNIIEDNLINEQVKIADLINGFINKVSSFNNLKNIKLLVIKLGEFLQFPKLIYGYSNSFNNSLNVSIDNLNMIKYQQPINDEFKYRFINEKQITTTETKFNRNLDYQKVNVYLGGVLFKYHQMNLGYQWLNNELANNEFMITRALGNRHFELILCDEYKRLFPNADTSQGFKNKLYLEIELMN